MTKRSRLVLAACAGLFALAGSGPALAAYKPKFSVTQTPPSVTSTSTTISILLTRDDDATAKVTFYAPRGYQAALGQAAGTQIGTVQATVQALRISADAILPLNGTVLADDPAKYTAVPQSVACAGPAQHAAVWILRLEAAGQTLNVPVYVDPVTAGPEATFASYKLQVCLPSPHIPPEQGGAAFGAKLLTAVLQLNQVYTAPSAAGRYVWPAIFTPYGAGSAVPNAPATVEARGIVALPAQLTLNGRITSRARRTIRLSGVLTEGGTGIPGLNIEILIGSQVSFRARTGARGSYSLALRRKGKKKVTSAFRARARVPERDVTAAGCATPTLAPIPCVSATAGAFTILSRIVRITL